MTAHVTLRDGRTVPVLGLGTWRMGESSRTRAAELAALRRAVELGYRLFDTAEMYGNGGAERLLGQALGDALHAGDVQRDDLFVVSKVLPSNAGRSGVAAACERSLRRLSLDRIDLYLLHWPGPHPLPDTIEGFETLRNAGRIGGWGVSNFDIDDMRRLWRLDAAAARCAANQVYFSLGRRGVEFDLAPWQRERGVALIAYCPIDEGALARSPALRPIAERIGATPAQLALAWLVRRCGTIAIPKAVREAHLRDNLAAAAIALDAATLAAIDAAFPPPSSKQPLAMT